MKKCNNFKQQGAKLQSASVTLIDVASTIADNMTIELQWYNGAALRAGASVNANGVAVELVSGDDDATTSCTTVLPASQLNDIDAFQITIDNSKLAHWFRNLTWPAGNHVTKEKN